MKIHQFTPVLAYGDSIANALLYTKKLINFFGYESNLYVSKTSIDINFKNEAFHISQYEENENNLILIHHSIGDEQLEHIAKFKDKKILVYHNITPPHFVENNKILHDLCILGREQLKDYKNIFIASYADSDYNAKELISLGYQNPVVMPILVNLDNLNRPKIDNKILTKYQNSLNILFVGRIVKNKSQHELLYVVYHLKTTIPNIKLLLVGAMADRAYYDFICKCIHLLGLKDNVVITNHVSNVELENYYNIADIYLSLSEHEGFGMPLVEAMKYDKIVLSYATGGAITALPETSLLFDKSPQIVAQKIYELVYSIPKKIAHIKNQKKHLKQFTFECILQKFQNFLDSCNIDIKNRYDNKIYDQAMVPLQIQGPFDSSYSLSLVNQQVAKAIHSSHIYDVSLYPTEGLGDYIPKLDNLDKELLTLYNNQQLEVDISIRNIYPPRTNAMLGYHKIIGPYGWEESRFLDDFVPQFNQRLTLVFTMSDYVKKTLLFSGITVPKVVTTGIVATDLLSCSASELPYSLPNGYRLLHVSSAFPRKGIDILLQAYESLDNTFSLIIKTFPNQHNDIIKQLDTLGYEPIKEYEPNVFLYTKNHKQILLINKDITNSQLVYLYKNSHLMVLPTKGEGFCLPAAEAMLYKLPVLITAYGGQSDFCDEDTAFLIDFEFEYAKTHMNLLRSYWLKPSSKSLLDQIYSIRKIAYQDIDKKLEYAKQKIIAKYSPNIIANNINQAINSYEYLSNTKEHKIAIITTYNTKCGIAEYSKYLISKFKHKPLILAPYSNDLLDFDSKNVVRCFNQSINTQNIEKILEQIETNQINQLILQYNFGFFSLEQLSDIILYADKQNIKTHIFFHSTAPIMDKDISLESISNILTLSTNIFVHTIKDLNYLKSIGIYKNTHLFYHGVDDSISCNVRYEPQNTYKTIATFGFLLPQKGIVELIEAVEILHEKGFKTNLLLLTAIHNASVSKIYHKKLVDKISNSPISKYITLKTDFLQEFEILQELSQADVMAYTYTSTQESSSAAVRFGVLTKKPIVVTPLDIFEDVQDIVYTTKSINPQDIANQLENVLKTHTKLELQEKWIKLHSWNKISEQFYYILKNY